MPIYECDICNFSTILKPNYLRHLNTKKHIKLSIKKNDNKNSYIKEVLIEKINDKDKQLDDKDKEIEELKKQVEMLNNSKSTYIKGNQVNITQYVILNAFGKEKIKYITSDLIKGIVENNPMNSVPKLLKEIHFNPEHNENHNIYIPNKKQGFAKIFDGEKWVLTKKKDAIEDMTSKALDLISNKESTKQMDKIRDDYDDHDKKTTNRIHEDTELMILNNQEVIEKEKIIVNNIS